MEETLVLTREQVRRVDALAVERYGMSSLVLMENAGRGAAEALLDFDHELSSDVAPLAGPPRGPRARVAILCGKGNNAGDGFVIARHLEIHGVAVKILLLNAAHELAVDARRNFEILTHTDMPIADLSTGVTSAVLKEHAGGARWLIDAILGTGAKGEPREPFTTAIRWMNSQPARRLAVDLPSGLDCDTGAPAAATVRADLTCTFVAPKRGFLADAAKPFLGELRVLPIGVPPRLVREVSAV